MIPERAAKSHGRFHIPSLDGIRALAFLMVFFGHTGTPGIPGGFGVTVFFFLSGYLITTLLRLEVERTGRVDFKLFYARRALRIWPPFYLVLAVAALLTVTGVLSGRLQLHSMLAQALHYSNYWMIAKGADGMTPGTGVYWSLSVEEHFYLVFPALYILMVRARLSNRGQQLACFAMCALVLAWRFVLVFWLDADATRTNFGTDTRVDSMLFGCALAVFGNPALDDGDQQGRQRPTGQRAMIPFYLGLLLLLPTFVVRSEPFRETLRYTLQGIALAPIFVAAIRYPGWGVFRVLNTPLAKYLGKLSYSLYLTHQIVIMATVDVWPIPKLVSVPIALAISVGLANLIWVLVEQPVANIRKHLGAAPSPAAHALGASSKVSELG